MGNLIVDICVDHFFVGLSVSDPPVAAPTPIPATAATSSRSKKRKTQPTADSTATGPTETVPAASSTAIVAAAPASTAIVAAAPASTEIVAAEPASTEIVAAEPASTEVVAMNEEAEGAMTVSSGGSIFEQGRNLVASALSGFNTTANNRKGKFKQHADFRKAREGRKDTAETLRKQKRNKKVEEKRSLGSPKQPGQQGYVQQQVATRDQDAQVQEAINGL